MQNERRAATIYGEHKAAPRAARFAAARDATALRGANEWHQRDAGTPAHTRTAARRARGRRDGRAATPSRHVERKQTSRRRWRGGRRPRGETTPPSRQAYGDRDPPPARRSV